MTSIFYEIEILVNFVILIGNVLVVYCRYLASLRGHVSSVYQVRVELYTNTRDDTTKVFYLSISSDLAQMYT